MLLLVAGFQSVNIVHAQVDYSFNRWLEVRDRFVKVQVAEQGISVATAIINLRADRADRVSSAVDEYMGGKSTLSLRRKADLEQYEKDKAEAAERGISFDEVLAERLEARAIAKKARAATEKKQQIRVDIALLVAAIIAIVSIAIVFTNRRSIAAPISNWWRRRNKAFRIWAFSSFLWVIGTFLFVWLVDPYNTGIWWDMDDDEIWHMFSVMIVPPLFLGAVWFGYKRFVDLEVVEIQPTDPKTGPEYHAEEIQRTGITTAKAILPVGRIRGVTVLIKVTVSAIAFFVLFFVAAVISEVTADRKFITQLFLALLFPSLVAIWYRTETSKRIAAALIGSIAGIAIWGLGIAMFYSGLSENPFIISAVVSSSMLASGALAFVVCRRKKASPAAQ